MRGNFITDRRGTLNPNYKDGRRNTRLYRIWANMKTRCYNAKSESYIYYGGRGVTICPEWLNDFQTFYKWSILNGYADNLTIDRIDVNGNYEPSNCRWVTVAIQSNNRRNNHFVTIDGITKTLSEWCIHYGVNYKTVRDRLRRGWNYIDALQKPIETKFGKKRVI